MCGMKEMKVGRDGMAKRKGNLPISERIGVGG